MPTAVVAGAIANKLRKGGEAWVRLSWALGLRSLGFDVHLLERIDTRLVYGGTLEGSQEAEYFLEVARRFGLGDRATLIDLEGRQSVGSDVGQISSLLSEADLLVNISGHLPLSGPAGQARRKVYVDVDPGYTQLWHAQGQANGLRGHDAFVTVGLAVGSDTCSLPSGGLNWLGTLPPVVLGEWPVTPVPAQPRFTTVASWRGGYGRIEHAGRLHGLKAHEFRKVVDLARRSRHAFELALEIDPEDAPDRAALVAAGWSLVDPTKLTSDPDSYRRYIQGSGAEFSVAQGIYVETGSGWFSDRTAHYLASGRPGLVQHTGINGRLPVGRGLLTFATLEEAIQGADAIMDDYAAHSEAARAFAERYLDADVVLGRLLEQLDLERLR